MRWNACVHRLDLGLNSHLKEILGNRVRTHVNSKGKIPCTGKNSPQRRIKPVTLHQAGQRAQHTTNELVRPTFSYHCHDAVNSLCPLLSTGRLTSRSTHTMRLVAYLTTGTTININISSEATTIIVIIIVMTHFVHCVYVGYRQVDVTANSHHDACCRLNHINHHHHQ